MKLVFTKSNSPLSLLIRGITGDDCSHFAFVFEGPGRSGLMIEANLLGTHPCFYQTSLKSHTVVHSFDVPLDIKDEDRIWDLVIEKYDGQPYDFLGAIYLGWRCVLKRAFKIPKPKKNKWSQPGQEFCDQIYDILNSIGRFKKIDVAAGMDTPHDVWIKLNEGNT